jgi:predicted acylesterase/phospholipase RssA
MSELARRIGGRSVGLVLSGGGARAFAHLGVLAELRRERIRIDRIGGVSLGAVVAALYACGNDPEQVREICMQGFVHQNPTNDFTVPLVSLIRGRKTLRLLHHYLGDVRIEELPVPFFCTSTDLVRREPVVHRTGPLAEAVMASLSIPGVFPPSRDPHGRLLVDGGVLDNLPVRAMNRAAEGPVIAVDVTGFTSADRAPANGRRPAVAAIVRRVVTGSDRRLPRLSETIVRCMTLASSDTVAAARRHADLVIAPEVSGIGMLDWRRLEQMQRAGADAARRALAARPALVASLRE